MLAWRWQWQQRRPGAAGQGPPSGTATSRHHAHSPAKGTGWLGTIRQPPKGPLLAVLPPTCWLAGGRPPRPCPCSNPHTPLLAHAQHWHSPHPGHQEGNLGGGATPEHCNWVVGGQLPHPTPRGRLMGGGCPLPDTRARATPLRASPVWVASLPKVTMSTPLVGRVDP